MTALLWAAAKGHAEVVMLLLVGGADIKAKDNQVSNITCISVCVSVCLSVYLPIYILVCVCVCLYSMNVHVCTHILIL